MQNNYLTSNSTSSNSIYTLFIQPYNEGYQNFRKGFSTKNLNAENSEIPEQVKKNINESLTDHRRLKHVVVGIILWCPIVNTICLLFLRLFNVKHKNNIPFNKSEINRVNDGKIKFEFKIEDQIQKKLNDPRLRVGFVPSQDTEQTTVMSLIQKEINAYTDNLVERTRLENWATTTFLTDFIDEYVFPYIHGELNPLDQNRKGLMQHLKENIIFFDKIADFSEIENKAFNIYLEINYRIIEQSCVRNTIFDEEVTEDQKKIKLLEALLCTLAIDFPHIKVENLVSTISKSIENTKKLISQEKIKPQNSQE
jgi:hypothetical protein